MTRARGTPLKDSLQRCGRSSNPPRSGGALSAGDEPASELMNEDMTSFNGVRVHARYPVSFVMASTLPTLLHAFRRFRRNSNIASSSLAAFSRYRGGDDRRLPARRAAAVR